MPNEPIYGSSEAAPVIPPPLPVLGMNDTSKYANTSGTQGEVPTEVARGWNWGAFFFSWVWLFAHRMPGYATAILVLLVLPSIVLSYVDLPVRFENIISFGVAIGLGTNGNRLAWRNRRFDSVEHLRRTERVWAYWGLGVVVATIAIVIFAIVDASN